MLLCLVAAFLVGCTDATVERGAQEVDPSQAIRTAVRDYLVAVAHNDYAARASATVGELQEWNSWIEAAGYVRGVEKAALEIEELKIVRVDESEATVDLRAILRFTTGKQVVLSGPVLLTRDFVDWKIVDYRRDGRSQRRAVRSKVEGEVIVGGITVKAVGWVLQKDYVDVFVRVMTRRYGSLRPKRPALMDGSGRTLLRGTVGPTSDGLASVHIEGTGRTHRTPGTFGNPGVLDMAQGVATVDYYWANRELEVKTKRIDLVLAFKTSDPSRLVEVTLVSQASDR